MGCEKCIDQSRQRSPSDSYRDAGARHVPEVTTRFLSDPCHPVDIAWIYMSDNKLSVADVLGHTKGVCWLH